MTSISITRALAKVKHLDTQIADAIANLEIVRVAKGEGESRAFISGNENIEHFEDRVKKDYQSLDDKIAHRLKLKAAITVSNTVTKVEIAGKSMTVAQAIEAKSQIAVQEAIIYRMQSQYATSNAIYNRETTAYEQREQNALEAYGGRDKAPKEEDMKIILKPIREKHLPSQVDPLGSLKVIEQRKKDLEEFRTEVDFVLSESNAKTLVEF